MRVLLFHPSLLPPKDYGGVERVVLWLAKGLIERGHSVTIAAFPGSALPKGVELLPVDPANRSAEILLNTRLAFDVVHFMAPPESGVIERLGVPSITTIHGNGVPGEIFPKNAVFLSRNHAERHGSNRFVYNGIDPGEFSLERTKKDTFLFLSKTSWKVKNVKGAIRYASLAGQNLTIAGGERPWGARLRARLAGFTWVGPVSGEVKAKLLGDAKALLFPVTWNEPFGLVVIEALMSGTPVIASRLGSLPELITSETGVLCGTDSEFIEALSALKHFDPEACRRHAIQHFSHAVMAENYEKRYKEATT